jgi:RNA polymerase sigma-70 factor (ECF subfamily)
MVTTSPARTDRSNQLARYEEAVDSYGAALVRLARSYEADPDLRQDLVQEIHLALWRSLALFDGGCSLRTWVYRVAHNAAATQVVKSRRQRSPLLVGLEAIDTLASDDNPDRVVERQLLLDELSALVRQLKPLDRQITVMYLEGLDASSIAEVTGISPGNVATKIHRIKSILAVRARQARTR